MSDLEKTTPASPSRAAWVTGILCVACCTIPFIGIAVGSATLGAFAIYAEGIAIGIAALGATWLAYKYISRRNAPTCNLDCSHRPTSGKDNKPTTD